MLLPKHKKNLKKKEQEKSVVASKRAVPFSINDEFLRAMEKYFLSIKKPLL